MKTVISASRRTDIPAFYLPWLIQSLKAGEAEVISPYGKVKHVELHQDQIHTIVLWSKNFHNFLKNRRAFRPYHLFFNFTINDCPILEPRIPGLNERLSQLTELAQCYGADRINWRFDPLVFWNEGKKNNFNHFKQIAQKAAEAGITRCLFSFCTYYQKVLKRAQKVNFNFYDPPLEMKLKTTQHLVEIAQQFGITLYSCCQKDLSLANVKNASCIDGTLLEKISGIPASKARDPAQREGCHCTKSVDIGSYTFRCQHACLYCYANPLISSP